MKYYIHIYGCQMNQSDAERIATVLEKLKYTRTDNEQDADLVVLVACSVRQSAINRIFGKIRNLKKKQVLVTGCVLKKDQRLLAEKNITFFDIKDLGNIIKSPLIPLFQRGNKEVISTSSVIPSLLSVIPAKAGIQSSYFTISPAYTNRHTAYIPIMTGCDNYCSYCVVPYTRGHEYSRPASEIIAETQNAIKNGYKRVFLLGQNVNSYFCHCEEATADAAISFPSLLEKINNLDGNFWITFTSAHPKDLTDKLIQTMKKCEKVCPYINLPAQSGNNEILQKMNRHYTVEQYLKFIEKLRKNIPDIAITTDIIVGFPRETKSQFQDTIKLFKKVKYDMAFINQYSPRPQTTAFNLKDNITKEEKNRRERELTEILKKTALKHNQKLVGQTIDILITGQDKNGNLLGITRTMKNVRCRIKNQESETCPELVKRVQITRATAWNLEGIFE